MIDIPKIVVAVLAYHRNRSATGNVTSVTKGNVCYIVNEECMNTNTLLREDEEYEE